MSKSGCEKGVFNLDRIGKSGKVDKEGIWYTWDEVCITCGMYIREHGTFISSAPPSHHSSRCAPCIKKELEEYPTAAYLAHKVSLEE